MDANDVLQYDRRLKFDMLLGQLEVAIAAQLPDGGPKGRAQEYLAEARKYVNIALNNQMLVVDDDTL